MFIQIKSIQYWPDEGDETGVEYGDVKVILEDTSKQADMIVRTFNISKNKVNNLKQLMMP